MNRLNPRSLVVAALAVLVASCRTVELPPRPNIPDKIDPIKELVGRRIVIDPGHGGPFKGAVSRYGLTEAEVNMAVSCKLAEYLEDAGARVKLTYLKGLPLTTSVQGEIKDDLQARVNIARDFNAELFVSVHHNADVSRESSKNDIEIYYKMGDDGPSLDVASRIQRHLSAASLPYEAEMERRAVADKLSSKEDASEGIMPRARKLLAGNYHVLRNSPMTAILTESSYMSHPSNARKVSRERYTMEEAYAIFKGIAEYYMAGVPVMLDVRIGTAGSAIRWGKPASVLSVSDDKPCIAFSVSIEPGGVDPATVIVTLDGKAGDWELARTRTPGIWTISHYPERPLRSGKHNVSIALRGETGNSAAPVSADFVVDLEPAAINVLVFPERISGHAWARVSAEVLDSQRRSVANGTPVTFDVNEGGIIGEVATTTSGVATTWLEAPGRFGGPELRITARTSNGATGHASVPRTNDGTPRVGGVVSDKLTRAPLDGAVVRIFDPQNIIAIDRTGPGGKYVLVCPFETALNDVRMSVRKIGYAPIGDIPVFDGGKGNLTKDIALVPIANGAFHGIKIALDAACGGPDSGFTGPTGIRAADVNLRVAEILRGLLIKAGAEVKLTRAGDYVVSPQARTSISNNFGANYFVSISHGLDNEAAQKNLDSDGRVVEKSLADITYASHYPTSKGGKALAEVLSAGVAELTGLPEQTLTSSAYVLTNTACPAVLVRAMAPSTIERGDMLRSADFLRAEARKLFEGLAEIIEKKRGKKGN
ncbi:N-acetylmuramoyl-L-alanine amidase [Candidatus Hydrogenedentota bacterium]